MRTDSAADSEPSATAKSRASEADSVLLRQFQSELRERVGERNYVNWFVEKANLCLSGTQVRVGVSSPFILKWMHRNFQKSLREAAVAAIGPSAEVTFAVDGSAAKPTGDGPPSGVKPSNSSSEAVAESKPATTSKRSPASFAGGSSSVTDRTPLRRRYASFTDFVVGPGSELAFTAARQVSEAPGQRYNPLYIHGEIGLGKTHLLEGIHQHARRRHPHHRVMYLTAETFGNYFSEALRSGSLPSFRQRFRNIDVLIVDDVQFFDAKRGFQKEFLHTFQQLHQQGRQIVLAADRHPRLLGQLSEELVTRFLSGIVCRIENPDVSDRLAIVRKKAERLGAEIAETALDYIARKFKRSVRELEGALNCLATHAELTGRKITRNAARKILSDLERDCAAVVRITDIEETVSEFFGVGVEDLKGRGRTRAVTQPRMVAMYLARDLLGVTYSEIGRHFGGRNHSTVMTAERKVSGWLDGDQTLSIGQQKWPTGDLLDALRERIA